MEIDSFLLVHEKWRQGLFILRSRFALSRPLADFPLLRRSQVLLLLRLHLVRDVDCLILFLGSDLLHGIQLRLRALVERLVLRGRSMTLNQLLSLFIFDRNHDLDHVVLGIDAAVRHCIVVLRAYRVSGLF
jgi:hypothetical protein